MSEEPDDSRSYLSSQSVLFAVGLLVAGYLGVFGLLYLDEVALETRFLSQYIFTSHESRTAILWIYWPILKLLRLV